MPAPRRDLELTRAQLRDWLAKQLSGAREVRIGELKGPSATGFSSDTLMFDAEWTAGGPQRARLVARLQPTGFTVFPTYDIAMQYRVMKALGDTDVPVPRMRWLEEDPGILGVPFLVMDRVDGRVPTDNPPYHTAGWIPELAPEERTALWWSGLDAMARVHRLDWKTLGPAAGVISMDRSRWSLRGSKPDRPLEVDRLAEMEGDASPLAQQLGEYDAYVNWGMDRRRHPLIERAQRWLRARQPADEPVGLCWGDARLGNQIFDGTRCVAVLDWEMVRLGDAVQDLAWWVALDRCFSEGLSVERLPGLPDRHATIARWEAMVGRPARHFEYYEVLALYKFAAIMSRVIQQMKYYEVFPADSDMDVNNLATGPLATALDELGG
jgi:aminoglycoside phosphotransferase (APT) family kinase protein